MGSMLAFAYRVVSEESESRYTVLKQQAQVLARNLAATGADHLLSRDYTSIEGMLLRAAQFHGVLSVQFADESGDLVGDVVRIGGGPAEVRYGSPAVTVPSVAEPVVTTENRYMTIWHPLELGALMGWVKIKYSLEDVDQAAARIWTANLLTALTIALIAITLIIVLLRRPVRSLKKYTDFAGKLDACEGKQLRVDNCVTEFGKLGHALNHASLRLYGQSAEIQQAITQLERLAAFAEDSPNFVVSMDEDARIQYINPRCRNFMTTLDLREQDLPRLLPNNVVGLAAKVIGEERTFRGLEVNYGGYDLLWTFAPVKGQHVLHAYGTDVTQRRQAEEKAQAALVEKLSADAANKAKSQFLASMSHELRTPLNAIIGYSEMLAEEAEDAEQPQLVEDLGKISHGGKHLLALINEILDLSKVEAGKMELHLEEFNLQRLLDEVLETVKSLADKNENTLVFSCQDEPGLLYADLTKLRQILLNLLSNACKFSRGAAILVSIDDTTINEQPGVVLVVEDEGIGMTENQLSKVFEPFTQADSSTTRDFGGTGLGLAITKRFCEMMGGRIEVTSSPGIGSRFVIELPRRVARNDTQEAGESDSHDPAEVRRGELGDSADRRQNLCKVLVIDDDATTLDLIEQHLRKDGFVVRTADSGEDGLRLAREIIPDVILLDVMMPQMDGWQVIDRIKNDPVLASVPVAMLSLVNDAAVADTPGADDYLLKPLNFEQMSVLVKKWVRKKT